MRVAIAGVAESDLGEVADKTILQMQAEAALAALADAGLGLRDVDGIATAGGEGIYAPGMLLAEYLGVQPRYTDSTNIGGASFVAHAGHACEAIRSGQCEVVL
ncbi:MAG TPA: thiolase, partial [Candidatus Dormibacteraeota bacterium]|nr:thiolase [Candidatus Dormibacteraeota bacterium]